MPIKRIIPRQLEENPINRTMKALPLPYYIIIIVIVFFAINVSYETYDDMSKTFSITDSQSKNCIIDFQKTNCNPLNLTEKCEDILECVQKEDGK